MENRIFKILLLISLNSIISSRIFGQINDDIVYIDKGDLKRFQISEIKDFSNSKSDSITGDSATYLLFQFHDGLLVASAAVSTNSYSTVEEAINNGDHYIYNVHQQLIEVEGLEGPGAHQSNFESYQYVNGRLMLTISGIHYWSQNSTGTNYTGFTKYFYYSSRKLRSFVEYNNFETPMEKVSPRKLSQFMIRQKTDKEMVRQLVGTKNNIQERVIYCLYHKNRLIGLYPEKDLSQIIDTSKEDTIYSQQKIAELKKIGFTKFSEKYFNKKVWGKIVCDNYIHIKKNELLINNKPIKEFLLEHKIPNKKNVAIEIADNDFLYYNITN